MSDIYKYTSPWSYASFLDQVPDFSDTMTLDAIKAMLDHMNNFQKELKVIHIAGTNGKGTTAKGLSSILYSANYKVASYTSPYINDYRETIHIQESMIPQALMNKATKKIMTIYKLMEKNNELTPTKYECLTVISLYAMYLEKVDFAVIETLMGGKDDATNVFESVLMSIITSISLDHTEYLGKSLTSITNHKSGIIKPNCPTIINSNQPEVIDQLIKVCKDNNSNYYLSASIELPKTLINSLNLKVDQQLDNIKGIYKAVQILSQTYDIPVTSIKDGLKNYNHPCRLECLDLNGQAFLFDGSHNAEGLQALLKYLKSYKKDHPSANLILYYGSLKEKKILKELLALIDLTSCVYLVRPNSPRAMDTNSLVEIITSNASDGIISKISTCFSSISDCASHIHNSNLKDFDKMESLTIICGSLYLACPLRSELSTLFNKDCL